MNGKKVVKGKKLEEKIALLITDFSSQEQG